MKNTLIISCLIFIGLLNSGCPKQCVEANYSFAVSSQVAPDLDSVKVGDTIFLESKFPTVLIDQRTGKSIDYSNSKGIESTLSIAYLQEGNLTPKGSVEDFKYYSVIGDIYNANNIPSPETVQQLRYQQISNTYQIKIGLIPQKTGVYAIGIGDGLSLGTQSNECKKASFTFILENTSHHIHYFQNWRPQYNLTASDISKLYCFKVN